ncbi:MULTISPECIES: acyl-CoA dehydrogenase family protein, partial [unclassified Sporosarcina]|uniref:acyl-CoA dehydrogenase family protein n=1 Tax=unclassified Sporosarcina TaxID=2647733 RepID=UPI00203F30D1
TTLIEKKGNEDSIQAEKLNTLGVKGSGLGLVAFNNSRVQEGNLLGTEIRDVLNLINFDRIGSIIMTLGMAEAAFEKALSYIRERKQFGKSIADFQGIQFMIAEMTASLKIIDHLVDLTIKEFRNDEISMLSLAINKIECTRLMEDIVSKSIDLMGGSGYLEQYEVERIFRDSKSVSIGGGTREVLKNLVGKQMVYKYKF